MVDVPSEAPERPGTARRSRQNTVGLVLCGIGVLVFSFTFPATEIAQRDLSPWLTGIGRAVVAALIALAVLAARRVRVPRSRRHLTMLVAVSLGIVIGFPLFTALALTSVTAVHAGVVTGLLPLSTAVFGRLRSGERLGTTFWTASVIGAVLVAVLTLRHGVGEVSVGDLFLVCAILAGGIGYAEGGALSKELPGWQVISWALVLSLPLTVAISVISLVLDPPHAVSLASASGFVYVAVFSMFLGFCAWYPGLARAGVERGSQIQLVQPLLTAGWSALVLGRNGIDTFTVVIAVLVVISVGTAQRARFRRR